MHYSHKIEGVDDRTNSAQDQTLDGGWRQIKKHLPKKLWEMYPKHDHRFRIVKYVEQIHRVVCWLQE
jgi:hypothetical protein